MVLASAYEGQYSRNPFNFQHFNVAHMSYTVNELSLPATPILTDYNAKNYVSAYRTLTDPAYLTRIPLKALYALPIAGQHFNGYCFTVFNLSGEGNTGELKLPSKFALTRFTVKFKTALSSPITLILYATFDDDLEIQL